MPKRGRPARSAPLASPQTGWGGLTHGQLQKARTAAIVGAHSASVLRNWARIITWVLRVWAHIEGSGVAAHVCCMFATQLVMQVSPPRVERQFLPASAGRTRSRDDPATMTATRTSAERFISLLLSVWLFRGFALCMQMYPTRLGGVDRDHAGDHLLSVFDPASPDRLSRSERSEPPFAATCASSTAGPWRESRAQRPPRSCDPPTCLEATRH